MVWREAHDFPENYGNDLVRSSCL